MNDLWRFDKFDSETFEFYSAKISNIQPENIKSVITDLSENKITYATIRIKSDEFPLIHALQASGFILIDEIISLSIDTTSLKIEKQNKIREAKKIDIPALKKLTRNLYSNTRITNDPMTKQKANDYYIKWIENSIYGSAADSILVWEEDEILGFVTLQKKKKAVNLQGPPVVEGQIPLIGVSQNSRGKGIAKGLLNAAFIKFKEWDVKTINIDTQMGNIPALRAYQSVGFKIVDSYLTLRWAS